MLDLDALAAALLNRRTSPYPVGDAERAEVTALIHAKAAALKKTTIICTKGKLTKKLTAVKPKCPAGYKVKK